MPGPLVDYFTRKIDSTTPMPTVSYQCACGRSVCTVSLNVGGIDGRLVCECGMEFWFTGSFTPSVMCPATLADHPTSRSRSANSGT